MSLQVILACVLFVIGILAVLVRKNVIIVLLGIELMLNAANLLFAVFSKTNGDFFGQASALFVIVVAAAEVVCGLALVILLFKKKGKINVDLLRSLKN
jgi:NADH-quinone oxidoreductase subunit K